MSKRARVQGLIPWRAIEDGTRPVDLNGAFSNLGEFLQLQLMNCYCGSWRNLLQSQPHHIELATEKLTLRTILSQVAQDHTMPMTIMRGMCALPAKKNIHDRYLRSRKESFAYFYSYVQRDTGYRRRRNRIRPFKEFSPRFRCRRYRSLQGRAYHQTGPRV